MPAAEPLPQDWATPRTYAPGRAVWNTRVYVLDEWLAPVPPGVVGELYVAGAALPRGFAGLARPTAELFVADPYGPAGSRLLRTGERAKWDAAGNLLAPGAAPVTEEPEETSVRPESAPPTPVEATLCAIVASILGRDGFDVEENFFETSMTSMKSLRLVALARKAGLEFSIADVFEHQTVRALAAVAREAGPARRQSTQILADAIDEAGGLDFADPYSPLLCMKPTGSRPPVFCLHSGVGFALSYMPLIRHLGAERPVYGIQAPYVVEGAPLPTSIEETAAEYIRLIKKVRPEGPYHLLGWSLGGLLAYEIAVQLRAGVTRSACSPTWTPTRAPRRPRPKSFRTNRPCSPGCWRASGTTARSSANGRWASATSSTRCGATTARWPRWVRNAWHAWSI